ncbi:MAG: hypothetical protein F6J93_12685 [Oscillatoria sp. SIO1A7]|nr:hypothetical protein [Oscillatoria sp. SIO1A7]
MPYRLRLAAKKLVFDYSGQRASFQLKAIGRSARSAFGACYAKNRHHNRTIYISKGLAS